jgi:hypothetical protein
MFLRKDNKGGFNPGSTKKFAKRIVVAIIHIVMAKP